MRIGPLSIRPGRVRIFNIVRDSDSGAIVASPLVECHSRRRPEKDKLGMRDARLTSPDARPSTLSGSRWRVLLMFATIAAACGARDASEVVRSAVTVGRGPISVSGRVTDAGGFAVSGVIITLAGSARARSLQLSMAYIVSTDSDPVVSLRPMVNNCMFSPDVINLNNLAATTVVNFKGSGSACGSQGVAVTVRTAGRHRGKLPVGRMAGNFSVTADGQASYRVPLWTPKVRWASSPRCRSATTAAKARAPWVSGGGWTGFRSRSCAVLRKQRPSTKRRRISRYDGMGPAWMAKTNLGKGPATNEFRKEHDDFSQIFAIGSRFAPSGFTVNLKDGRVLPLRDIRRRLVL